VNKGDGGLALLERQEVGPRRIPRIGDIEPGKAHIAREDVEGDAVDLRRHSQSAGAALLDSPLARESILYSTAATAIPTMKEQRQRDDRGDLG